jgi:prepilin-type N-terminal cleavage/methylation domain-containing protein
MKARNSLRSAFTLIEVILVIAAVGVLSSAGYYTVTSVRETARSTKLETDVANLNSAIQLYQANGGDLSTVSTAEDVIAKLKTRGDADTASFQVGMKGSFIDPRIVPVTGSGGQTRAIWNDANKRFAIATSGGTGISEFALDESLAGAAPVTEARARTLVSANVQSETPVWVWDYTDATPVTYTEGGVPVVVAGSDPDAPTGPTLAQLEPPAFVPPGQNRSLEALGDLANITSVLYDGTIVVAINNPNEPIPSHIDRGSSATITASADGITLSAVTISDDPDVWRDSEPTTETYSVQALALTPSISFTKSNPTPYDLGIPSTSGTGETVTATARISEWGSIPELFQDPRNFQLAFVTGTTSPTGQGGVAEESVSMIVTTASPWVFGSDSATLNFSASVNVENTGLFTETSPTSQSLTVSKLPLAVAFTPPSGSTLAVSESITIGITGTFPASYTIRYTVDGSTPSASNGATYGGPFVLSSPGQISVKAIALPSSAYSNWFTSPLASANYTVTSPDSGGTLAGLIVSQISKFNGTVEGSVQLLSSQSSNWNASVDGNVYLPGTPLGIPSSISVVQGVGSALPVWNISIPSGDIEGVVYTRTDPVITGLSEVDQKYVTAITTNSTSGLPAITIPTTAPNLSVGNNRTVNITTDTVWKKVSVPNNGTLVLGTSSKTTYFTMEEIDVKGQLRIAGPVVLYIKGKGSTPVAGTINGILGTETNPSWLTIYSQGSISVGGSGTVYANKIVSNREVTLQSDMTLEQGIIASSATLTGQGVLTVGLFTGN